ncbi:MAG: hypothetical protein Q8K91_01160 [Hylemonella sp.]|nr:hypothetical protein [Hylemonella sp.]MDP1935795.1 hypothetical protein [Hylemonella sp.]
MTSKKPAAASKKTASMNTVPETEAGNVEQVMARPDGYYWRAPGSKQEFGPFASLEDALADMQSLDEESPAPGETLQEAESELGIADWIDPETGEPAEGLSPPHIDEE